MLKEDSLATIDLGLPKHDRGDWYFTPRPRRSLNATNIRIVEGPASTLSTSMASVAGSAGRADRA
jgi:hypothetical protein